MSLEKLSGMFLPDLSLWYEWHSLRGTLPQKLQNLSLSKASAALEVPGWIPVRPWKTDFPGLDVSVKTGETEIVRTVATSKGKLVSRWVLGPDGDWWQSEYPVKSEEDLPAADEYCRAKRYYPNQDVLKTAELNQENDLFALRLPQQPFSEVLHDLLGFDEGIIILMQQRERIGELITLLGESYNGLVDSLTGLPPISGEGPHIFYSPDNLDSQFITPDIFDQFLRPGYEITVEKIRRSGCELAVHVGGYINHLLGRLGETGIGLIQGISGPPQSDAALEEARRLTGLRPVLWGGIPQDAVLPSSDKKELDNLCSEIRNRCTADKKVIVGVSDKVPVDADLSKIEYIRNFFLQSQSL